MTALLDVNVLVALAWPNHVHHAAAWEWFDPIRVQGWATCPVTEAGFVRVSCIPSAVRQTVTPLDAFTILAELLTLETHTFWPMDRSLLDLPEAFISRLQGYRQVTDALLLATAMRFDGQFATFDTGLERLLPPAEQRLLTVIPV